MGASRQRALLFRTLRLETMFGCDGNGKGRVPISRLKDGGPPRTTVLMWHGVVCGGVTTGSLFLRRLTVREHLNRVLLIITAGLAITLAVVLVSPSARPNYAAGQSYAGFKRTGPEAPALQRWPKYCGSFLPHSN